MYIYLDRIFTTMSSYTISELVHLYPGIGMFLFYIHFDTQYYRLLMKIWDTEHCVLFNNISK